MILADHFTELPNLIWLCLTPVALQNYKFRNPLPTENMVTASLSLGEAQLPKQSTQGGELATSQEYTIELPPNRRTAVDTHEHDMTIHRSPNPTWLALLRGINVGGRNVIRMADLKKCFQDDGFRDVVTYIQSGNVIFRSASAEPGPLTARIEGMLAAAYDYKAKVALRSYEQMLAVVEEAPAGFGVRPDVYRYDVLFLFGFLTAADAMEHVRTRSGVDEAWTGEGVLYFSRLIEKASRSHLSRLASMPVYQSMTIRNWRTTTRLLELMGGREG